MSTMHTGCIMGIIIIYEMMCLQFLLPLSWNEAVSWGENAQFSKGLTHGLLTLPSGF